MTLRNIPAPQISPWMVTDLSGLQVIKQGAVHKLVFGDVQDEYGGKYSFIAERAESEVVLHIADPPVIDPTMLEMLSSQPVTVKADETATIRIPFKGKPAPKVTWHRDGLELVEDSRTIFERNGAASTLKLSKCVREDCGTVMLKLRNDYGSATVNIQLGVLDRPKPPQGKVDFMECSGKCITMKWKAPRDNGRQKVNVIERQVAGKKGWREPPGMAPQPQIAEVIKDEVTVMWAPPAQVLQSWVISGEKKKGSSMCVSVCKALIQGKDDTKYAVGGLVEDMEYEFRVIAVNRAGEGIASAPGLVRNFMLQTPPTPPSRWHGVPPSWEMIPLVIS
ncbi:immunoglobulin superfamily member 22 [Clarias magur]|nr:immunoglobulin superfamily member 22 [Clarias magur]